MTDQFRVARPIGGKSQVASAVRASLTRTTAGPSPGQPTPSTDFPSLLIEWLPGEGPYVTGGLWSNITSNCIAGTIQRGRHYELDRFAAGRCSLTLRSTTRLFDPDNPSSTYYPNVVPMRQLRVSATYAVASGLVLSGTTSTYAATPHATALGLTADIDLRVKVAPANWSPAAEAKLISKENAGGTLGYALSILSTGRLRFVWSNAGAILLVDSTANPTGVVNGVATWIRVTRAVTSGAVTFYQSTDGNTWTQIGNAVISVPGGVPTAETVNALTLGARSFDGGLRLTGTVFYADVRSSIGTTIVASPNFESLGTSRPGSAPFTDNQANVWTLTGDAVVSGTDTAFPLFYGYVTDWGQTVEADNVFFTTIEVKDAFALLEMTELPSSAWALEVQKSNPTMWLRLGETDTVRVTDSSDGGNYGLYDNVDQGADGLVPNDDDGAVDFGVDYDPADSRVVIQNTGLITGYPFTFSTLIKAAARPEYHRVIFAGLRNTTTFDPALRIYLEAASGTAGAGRYVIVIQNGGALGVGYTQPIDDDKVHHMCNVVTSTQIDFYIDGVFSHSNLNSAAWIGTVPSGYTLGNYTDTHWGAYGLRGVMDETCLWNGTALSAATIAAQALAAKSGWDNDDSGARVTRFLDAIAWPASLRNISGGISVLGPASWTAGQNALEVMFGWADTELGAFFIDTTGRIVWRNRHYPWLNSRAATPQCVFIDGNTTSPGIRYLADGFELLRDEALIRNPIQAGRVGGVTVQVKDQTYINKYGNRTWNAPSSQDRNDAVIRDRATWMLGRYKELGTRLGSMRVRPRRDPGNMFPKVLALDLGDQITVKRKPLGLNAEISTNQIIESLTHNFSASQKDWVTTYTGSPVDASLGQYLVLDDPTYGRLDSFRLAY